MTPDESLLTASHSLDFVKTDLRCVLQNCTAVESIVILQLIEEVAATHNKLNNLVSARKSDKEDAAR